MSERPPLLVLIKAQIQADPKKAAIMVVLLIIMIGVYVRMFTRSGATAEAGAAILPPQNLAAVPAPGAANGSAPTAPPAVRPRVPLGRPLHRELTGDPFRIPPELMPQLALQPELTAVDPAGPQPDNEKTREEALRLAASALTLQSTLCGDKPLAGINGRFFQPGDAINGFILERVEPDHVVLTRDGAKFALQLK